MQQTRIEALQRMPIFGGIRADVLEFLLDASGMVSVDKGQVLSSMRTTRRKSMFVLEAGAVSVLKLWGGQQCVLRRLDQGDCFGEMALMDVCFREALRSSRSSTAPQSRCRPPASTRSTRRTWSSSR